MRIRKAIRVLILATLLATASVTAGCDQKVGVGFSVGIPTSWGGVRIGVGSGGWYGGPHW
jgi:hypothetical protein